MICTEVEPVEESIPHHHCKTAVFSKTVFDEYYTKQSSITAFKELPMFTTQSVFKDDPEILVSNKQ